VLILAALAFLPISVPIQTALSVICAGDGLLTNRRDVGDGLVRRIIDQLSGDVQVADVNAEARALSRTGDDSANPASCATSG